ncbi:Transcriptional regulator, TetR family [Pseudonocardia sp. Ae406_Ps2]|uniref:TetR/AcrR family transcriptional regulator n=1 Tax=Pseudonocardia sp. EV170527-09 TaxID=2603411 RepID=UPI000959AAB6|nr:TetR/AcrR family transcriptional regulator [Pseudonocardia sp. EV170527-09]OLL97026.1 Transcriptional regulator, TetR family [Pseudonocardia sp. Ae331_Ps2]OLM05267.1 Transcriptional regulator, TetR family [Pseudonocardia sp. Ae406_Ps2]OLM26835.1 Transcriptional regulator, TetR family [Pseudonocardia sp. Ae706_Ps2]OLM33102.1 Transcriptional regulator, TetR family [Pseudonocardia sp. Ae717_Ps2]KAA1021144.1 TetR/AcrR family transcriptional regulator [Pseudonocardia sp. EV170527-09]
MTVAVAESVSDAVGAERTPTTIAEGVFFTTPPALPRGRHRLSREEVYTKRRERMMIAATELLAGDGYRNIGVREICARAGVSLTAFYEVFSDKDECMFAAFDRFVNVIVGGFAEVHYRSDDWTSIIRHFTLVYLDLLGRDIVVARAFLVELEPLGREARHRNRLAMQGIAALLEVRRREWAGGVEDDLESEVFLVVVYALRQLAVDILDAPNPSFDGCANRWTPWLARLLPPPTG